MFDLNNIDENVYDFLKLVTYLNNLLLSSLSHMYDHLKQTLKYGSDTLNLSEVTGAAQSKEI